MIIRVSLGLTTLLFSLAYTPSLHAASNALLVGVNNYAEEAIPNLRGPVNDVLLMKDVLEKIGVEKITILANDLEGVDVPTHAAILAAFEDLAESASDGDFIYIHLSGHGSRQIDSNQDETDGLDEIFLPMDAARAPNGATIVPNALTDDEIGEWISKIRATGADVFLVMDSCYSGSGIRAPMSDLVDRQIDPLSLGINLSAAQVQGALVKDRAPIVDLPFSVEDSWGDYLAFYATQSNDVAREADLSRGAAKDDSQWYGIFSSKLAARLASKQAQSYRQLFQSVLADLTLGSGFGMAAVQTPLWEGSMIDAAVFGGKGASGPIRYFLNGDRLDAGRVHGLQTGTLMALVAEATDEPDAILGYAQVIEAGARSAYLRPVNRDCLPRSGALCPAADKFSTESAFAQVEMSPLDHAVRFSPILSSKDGTPVLPDKLIVTRLASALEVASNRASVATEFGGGVYAVQVLLEDGMLWFGPSAQIDREPVGLSFDIAEEDEQLVSLLIRILRAERLAEVLNGLDSTNSNVNPSPITVDANRFESSINSLNPPGIAIDARQECRIALAGVTEAGFQTLVSASDMKQCDLLRFSAIGNRWGQRDVNRIHIDAQYCIHVDYELIEGAQASRMLGEPMVICSDCPGPTPYSAGHERLYFLVSEVQENREALNLEGLIENCNAVRQGVSERSTARTALAGLFEDMAARTATRGDMGLGRAVSDVWVQGFRWRVIPRAVIFSRNEIQ